MNEPINDDSKPVRGPDGRFLPGNVANPKGRPVGSVSGRTQALRVLDQFLDDDAVQATLGTALRQYFYEDPVRFFKQIIMPLLPTNMKLSAPSEKEERPRWIDLIKMGPITPQKTAELEVVSE